MRRDIIAMPDRGSHQGNIFFMLFAAVALVGAFGIGATTVMRGLVTSMSDVTRKTIAEERMTTAARLTLQHAAQFDPAADCDSATENTPGQIFLEPMVTRDAASLPHPANGGLIPENIGASVKDPWGTQYGYCAWDPGPAQCATSVSPRRLAGTADPDDTVVAIVSAGKDRVFQTTCNPGASPATTKAEQSDDIIMEFTYNDVQGLGGDDLWKVKDIAPDTATIEKNIEVTGGADFTGAINLMAKGLILPTDADAGHTGGSCTTAQQGEMRINTATSPISLEICHNNSWVPLSMSGSGSGAGPADCTGLGSGRYHDPLTGHCYYYQTGGHSGDYAGAESFCTANGDYLAVISSAAENATIYDNIVKPSGYGYWLGGNNLAVPGEWRWLGGEADGVQFWSGDASGSAVGGAYTNWEPSQPDYLTSHACVRIGQSADGLWDSTPCSGGAKRALCERVGTRAGGNWLPPAGLIGWWKFDEPSGTVTEDSSPANNTGTLSGGATFATGVSGNAVSLDGTDDYVTMGSPAGLDETIRSACAWIYPDNLPASSVGAVLGKTNGGSTGPRLYINGAGDAGGAFDGALQQSNGILSQNGWHHLCMTWTGTSYTAANVKIYLNGAAATGSVTASGSTQSDAALNFVIGQASGANFFKGKIDEVMVFDRELTEAEITGIYQNTSDSAQSGGSCNFSNITLADTESTGGQYDTIVAHNGYVWTADYHNDRIYYNSVADPSSIGVAAYIQDGINLDKPSRLAAQGNYLYVLSPDNGRLTIVDISSPAAPVVRGSGTHAFLGQGQYIIPVDQNYVAITSTSQDRMTLVNVSNPASPSLGGSVAHAGMTDPYGMDISGNHIYVASQNALTIWDITDRNNIVLAGQLVSSDLNGAVNVKVQGSYAYVLTWSQNKIVAVNTSSLAAPVVAGSGTDARMNQSYGMKKVGNYLFTASSEAILAWSLLNPKNPMVVGSYLHSSGSNAALSVLGRYAYNFYAGNVASIDLGCDPGGDNGASAVSGDMEPDPAVIIAANQYAGKLASGSAHSCHIKPDSSLWCGGSDATGQLGIGVDDAHKDALARAQFTAAPWPGMVRVSASAENSCAVDTEGLGWCWGAAGAGKLGNGTAAPQANNPLKVSGGDRFAQIDVGGAAVCGIAHDGRILCWGSDTSGVLGNGGAGASNTPSAMPDTGPWIKVAVGAETACGIKIDGSAWCWGKGNKGQAGNSTALTSNQSPLLVEDTGPWLDIVASFDHVCGIKIDGSAWCWGAAAHGKLGNGVTTGNYLRPQRVLDSGPWIQLATNKESGAAKATTCGIKIDGSAWCWGNNEKGQIGNGTKENSASPARVADPGPWALITVGDGFSCGMKTNGSVWCWGEESTLHKTMNGPDHDDTNIPVPVSMSADPAADYVEANISIKAGSAIGYDGSAVSGVANGLRFDTGGQTVLRQATASAAVPQILPPVTNGLIGYWSFNEAAGSTTAVDIVGGNTATLAGNAKLMEGRFGNALYIAAAGDYADAGSAASLDNTIVSACAWVNQQTGVNALPNSYGQIIRKITGTTGFNFYTTDYKTGKVGFGFSKNEAYIELQSSNYLNDQWNHVCVSWSGEGLSETTLSLYINGQYITPSWGDVGPMYGDDSAANLTFGNVTVDPEYDIPGYIDEVMIFNRPLTAGDVAAIYSTPYYDGSVDLRLDTQAASASSQISWKAASAGTTRTLGLDYLTRSLELGNNNAAVTNWTHAISPVMEITDSGNVGIGTTGTANARLDISSGGLRIGNDTGACFLLRAGTIRYVGGATAFEYCNGTSWQAF